MLSKLKIIIVSFMVLGFVSCGGGGGGRESSQYTQTEEQKVRQFNTRMMEHSKHTSKISDKIVSILKVSSNNFTKDITDISYKEAIEVMNKISELNALLDEELLLKYELANIISSSSTLQKDLSRGLSSVHKPKKRAVFTIGAGFLAAGIGYALKTTLFDTGKEVNEDRNKITESAISALTPRDLKKFNKYAKLGLPENTTSSQLLAAYKKLSFKKKNFVSTKMMAFATESLGDENTDLDPEFAEIYRENSAIAAVKLGKAAVVAEANLITSALGGQGVDKLVGWMARNIGLSEAGKAVVAGSADMLVTISGHQVLDHVGNLVTASASKRTKKIIIKKSNMDLKKAKETLKDDDASQEEKEEARNKIIEEIGKKTKTIKKDGSSEIELEVPEKTSIQTNEDVKDLDEVKVGNTGDDSIILVVAKDMIPEIKKNISALKDGILEISTKPISTLSKPDENEQNLDLVTVTHEKVSEDGDSISYIVKATATNLKENAKISISISEGAVSNRTKTLKKGGSVSWMVSVLKEDATFTVSIKGQIYDGVLKGAGKENNDTNFGNAKEIQLGLSNRMTCISGDSMTTENKTLRKNYTLLPYVNSFGTKIFRYKNSGVLIEFIPHNNATLEQHDLYFKFLDSEGFSFLDNFTSDFDKGKTSGQMYNSSGDLMYCNGTYTATYKIIK